MVETLKKIMVHEKIHNNHGIKFFSIVSTHKYLYFTISLSNGV